MLSRVASRGVAAARPRAKIFSRPLSTVEEADTVRVMAVAAAVVPKVVTMAATMAVQQVGVAYAAAVERHRNPTAAREL